MLEPSDQFQWWASQLNTRTAARSGAHFHIQWSGREWWKECFETRAAATARALELSGPNEAFIIIEVLFPCLLARARAVGSDAVDPQTT